MIGGGRNMTREIETLLKRHLRKYKQIDNYEDYAVRFLIKMD